MEAIPPIRKQDKLRGEHFDCRFPFNLEPVKADLRNLFGLDAVLCFSVDADGIQRMRIGIGVINNFNDYFYFLTTYLALLFTFF